MNELAELLGLEHTTLTRSAAPLERNGWVRPGRPENPRQHPLLLTPAGRRKLEAALPAWKAAQEVVTREFERLSKGSEIHRNGRAAQASDQHRGRRPR